MKYKYFKNLIFNTALKSNHIIVLLLTILHSYVKFCIHIHHILYKHSLYFVFIFIIVMFRRLIPPTLVFRDTHGRLYDDPRNSSLPFQVHQPNWSSDFVVFQHDARRNTWRSVFFAGVFIWMSEDDGRGWHEGYSLCPLMPYVSLALNFSAAHPQVLLVSQVLDCFL